MAKIENNKKYWFFYIKLTNQLPFEANFQKVNQHTGGEWVIRGNKPHKDNQRQCLFFPVEFPSWKYIFHIKEPHGNMLDLIFYKKIRGQKHHRKGAINWMIEKKLFFKTTCTSCLLSVSQVWWCS